MIIKAALLTIAGIVQKPAIAAGVVTSTAASISGLDPWPWILATLGMVYMVAKTEPDSKKTLGQMRREALSNGMVSLICGGLGGPATASIAATYNEAFRQPYLLAFLISAFWQVVAFKLWPWVLTEIWPIAKSWLQKKGAS